LELNQLNKKDFKMNKMIMMMAVLAMVTSVTQAGVRSTSSAVYNVAQEHEAAVEAERAAKAEAEKHETDAKLVFDHSAMVQK